MPRRKAPHTAKPIKYCKHRGGTWRRREGIYYIGCRWCGYQIRMKPFQPWPFPQAEQKKQVAGLPVKHK